MSMLADAESRYRAVFDAARDAMIVYTRDGIIVEANAAACTTYGYTREQLIGLDARQAVHPDARPHFEQFLRVTAAGGDFRCETVDRRRDGTTFPIEVTGTAFNLDGQTHLMSVVRDISERRRSEEALRRSEEQFRLMADAVPQIVWITDAEGRVQFFNRHWSDYTGVRHPIATADDVAAAVIHPEDRPATKAAFDRARQTGETFVVEHRIRSASGEYRWFLVRGEPSRDAQTGQITRWFGASVDIHDRTRAEEALRAHSAVTESVTSNAAEALYLLDAEGLVTFANPASEAMFGWAREEMLGRKLHDAIHYKHPDGNPFPMADCTIGQCFASGLTLRNHEDVFVHRDGSFVPVLCSMAPIRQDGRVTGAVLAVIDITDRRRAEEALRASEERHRVVLQSLDEGVTVHDTAGAIVMANPAAERILGQTLAQMRGVDSFDSRRRAIAEDGTEFPPERHPPQMALRTGQSVPNTVFGIYRGDDTLVWVSANAAPLLDPVTGETTGAVASFFDVTEQRRVQHAAADLRRKRDAALLAGEVGTFEWEVTEDRLWGDRNFERIFGISLDPSGAASINEYVTAIHPDDRAMVMERVNRTVETGCAYEAEYRIVSGERVRWVAARGTGERDGTGRVVRFPGVVVDITDRKRTEETLRQHERQLQLITDTAPVFISYCDRDRRFRFVNRQYAERFGLQPDQLVGRTIAEVLGEPAHAALQPYIERVLSGAHVEFEIAVPYQSLGKRWMQCRYAPEFDERGEVQAWVSVILDVTKRREVEEALRQAKDEAERASEAKSEFLATLSHELRTPLTPVLLTVSLMESHPGLPDDLREDVAAIRRNVELESRLISDLLDLTRVSKGKLQMEMQEVDLHLIVRSAVDICQREASARLDVDLAAARHAVRGDGTRLQQVFWNLINNAIKFTPENGTISVRTRNAADGRIAVDVSDTGAGIDPDVLPKLFNAFEQGEVRASRMQAGLGLGLAISKKLAEAHGGTIAASSAGLGRGATFTVDLPVLEHAARSPKVSGHPRLVAKAAQPLNVLLVEDHEPTLRVMERLLRQIGHRVTGVGSVASALAAARQDGFDLIISDLGLPDGSGMDVIRHLSDRYAGRSIALTGYGMEADVAASRAAGFAAHLTKPVDFAALDAAIQRVAAMHAS